MSEVVYLLERRHKALTLGEWFEVARGDYAEMAELAATAVPQHPDRDYRVVELRTERVVVLWPLVERARD